jgi:anti-sigma-K factor RskA
VKPSSHDLHLLTGAYALDALDASEAAGFERHLDRCPVCAEETRGLAETAARLAMATAIEPPSGMRQHVLDAATRTRQLPPPGRTLIPLGSLRSRSRRVPTIITVTTMAAAIVVLLVLQVTTWHQLQDTRSGSSAIAAVLAAPDARLETSIASTGGTVTAVISSRDHEAVITTTGMPAQPDNRVYQLWVISSTGARSAGLLPASRSGATTPVLAVGVQAGDSLGITVEPAGGTTRPTTTPIVVMPTRV